MKSRRSPATIATLCADYLRARGWLVVEPDSRERLHRDIVNLACDASGARAAYPDSPSAYRAGHRHARHAAAELVAGAGDVE